MFQFYKGRTNNHLTWVMVDATDFATPESALSAATKIKIWGKLRGQAAANFVSSGTGSLTNDIVHVGPSVLGIYSIALVKADLSDASAAWYDQYVISLSATGAAYQTLIADGGIDLSAISAYQSRLSDLYSMLSDMQSDFQSRVPKRVATDSQLSDLASDLRSYLVGLSSMESDLYSQLSDFRSDIKSFVSTTGVQLNASSLSDIRSAIAAGPAATVTASDISDIASAVWANTIGARVDSRILVAQSFLSDIRSHVSDLQSDFQSRVPKAVATNSQLSDLASDIKSAVAGVTATLSASDLSDIRSAIAAAQSDIRSLVSSTGPTISDIGSAVWADPAALLVSSRVSDVQSALTVVQSMASDAASAAAQVNSRVLVAQSYLSDIRSHVSDLQSDFQSRVPKLVATNSQLSDLASDVKSAVAANAITTAGVATAVWDELTAGHTTANTYGDKFGAHLKAVLKVVVAAGSTTTSVVLSTVDGAAGSATDDFYNGRVIIFTSGALAGQATSISDYTGATTTLTVVALTGAPANNVTAVIV